MPTKFRDLQGFAVLLIALLAGGFLLLRNAQPQITYTVPGPTATTTPQDSSWQEVIETQMINGSTALPTSNVPPATFNPPTLPPVQGTPIVLQPTQIFLVTTPTPTRYLPATPTRPGPTEPRSRRWTRP